MARPQPKYVCIGLDLGQAHEFTALVVLTRPRGQAMLHVDRDRPPTYALPFAHRFPLGTPYPLIVAHVTALLQTPELRGATLVVDRTAVGRAVGDLFAHLQPHEPDAAFYPLTITSGHSVTPLDGGGLSVPKRELVGVLQVLLQSGRLQIAPALTVASLLVQELQHFRSKLPTSTANDTLDAWREGQHDDLVLATALAAWVGERQRPDEGDPGLPHVGAIPAWSNRGGLEAAFRRYRHA